MYAQAFGLQHAPFSIAPDPRYLFMSERHREALAHLLYGLGASGGFVLLTGEIGTGKTTVCRCFLEQIPPHCDVAYVFNPKQSAIELLRTICDEFGVAHAAAAPGAVETVKDCIDPLNAFLLRSHAAGRHAVLVVDEAQNLSADVLEQLRLLTNLETSERKLLQIVLIGQPELRSLLAQPALEQLAQRVVARFHLDALSAAETEAYVAHRLAVAGWSGPPPFDRRALRQVHRLTGGVPRRINLLCDRALLGAYAAGSRTVNARMVAQAGREVFDSAPAVSARRRRVGAAVALVLGGALAATAVAVTLVLRPAVSVSPAVVSARPVPAPVAVVPKPPPAAAVFDLDAALLQLARSEDAAWRALAAAWGGSVPDNTVACPALARQGLQCFRAARAGLGLLRQLDRPALLPLVAPDGKPAWLLMTGLSGDTVTLDIGGKPERFTTAALAAWWRGDVATLWRVPVEAGAPARATPTDAWLDQHLGALQPELPAGTPRAERISRFQLAQGLPPDGQAGPLTAMRLNRASGVDEPRLR